MQTELQKFESFHQSHPDIYRQIVKQARAIKAKGFKHFGIRRIWEGLRWFAFLESGSDAEFKLNDHLVPRFSRLVMAQEPDLAGFFRTRKAQSDEVQS